MADTAARLAISARRNEVARFTIAVTGIDMTGVPMAMQIRLGRDVPGAPLIALATVGTLAAEGLKLDSVTVTNGVTTSIIKGRINASTMTDATKVPYAGEMGDNTTLAYAMQWTLNGDAQTRLYGDFVVIGSAFGSDNAPSNRPQNYGVSATSGGSSGGSLTFGDQVIRVSIAAIDQLMPLLATATAAAADAKAQAVISTSQASDARSARTAAEAARDQSGTSAATADSAKAAVLAAIGGAPITALLELQAVSIDALQAITERSEGRQASLSQAGRAGLFGWSGADLSSMVAIDAQKGIYIAPAGQNGSQGAWVRVVNPGRRWQASWFGLPNALTTDDSSVMRSIDTLRPAGTAVKFGPGTFKIGNIKIFKPGWWSGAGKLTIIQHSGTSNVDTFGICTQGGTRFSHMRFTGLVTPDNANARFPLYVCARPNETDYPQDSEDHEFDHLWFDGCSTGIRVSYGAAMVNGSPVFFTPNRTSIHHCVLSCTYQDIIPESRDIHIYKNSFLRPDTSDNARPFAHCLRILGCNRVTIEDNYFELPINFVGVAFMLAGVDDGTQPIRSAYRTANDVAYRNNRTVGGLGLQIRTPSGVLRITGNKHWRDPTRTDLQPWIGIYDATPAFFGSIIVQDNHVVGFTTPYFVENTSIHHFRSRGNTFVGNAYAGGVFDAAALLISIAGNDQAGNPLMAPKLIEIIDDTFILSESACIPIVFRGGYAAQWAQTRIIVRGAVLPYSPQPNYQIMQRGGGDGDPLVYLGFGTGLARFSTLDPAAMRVSAGDNIRLDADGWSQFRTNMDRPETIMGSFPPVWA